VFIRKNNVKKCTENGNYVAKSLHKVNHNVQPVVCGKAQALVEALIKTNINYEVLYEGKNKF
jgi:hypothetical protein